MNILDQIEEKEQEDIGDCTKCENFRPWGGVENVIFMVNQILVYQYVMIFGYPIFGKLKEVIK